MADPTAQARRARLDDGMAALDIQARSDLLEIIHDRAASKTPSSPANCRSSIGTHGWAMPPLPMRSSIA